MLVAKIVDNATVPANRLAEGQHFREIRKLNFIPLNGLAFEIQEGRAVVEMIQFANRLFAEHATFVRVPVLGNVPHPMTFGIGGELGQAILIALFALGPTRASFQLHVADTCKGRGGRVPIGDFYSLSFLVSGQVTSILPDSFQY